MQVIIPNDGQAFFDLNRSLLNIPAFGALKKEGHLMIFVALVADYQSPFYKQEEEKKRYLACICTPYLHKLDKPTAEGKRCISGQNKAVENAIMCYSENINPKRKQMVTKMLEALYSQWDNIVNTLKYGDDKVGEDGEVVKVSPEENLKLQDQCNKTIKDGIDKKVWESIQYYEDELSFMYKPKEMVTKFIDKDEEKVGEGIDNLSEEIDNL